MALSALEFSQNYMPPVRVVDMGRQMKELVEYYGLPLRQQAAQLGLLRALSNGSIRMAGRTNVAVGQSRTRPLGVIDVTAGALDESHMFLVVELDRLLDPLAPIPKGKSSTDYQNQYQCHCSQGPGCASLPERFHQHVPLARQHPASTVRILPPLATGQNLHAVAVI